MDTIAPMLAESTGWEHELSEMFARISGRFGRREMQARALDYIKGLRSVGIGGLLTIA